MKTINKLVSIITPVYNGEKYIERCIKSVIDQSYDNIEHIIVNDGSTDNTINVCRKYEKKIKLLSKENAGVSLARNLALKEARGEYVLFVDADDWLEKDMCLKLVKAIEMDNASIAICAYNNFYENTNTIEQCNLINSNKKGFIEQITDANSNFGGFPWNKLIRKNDIKVYFDEDVHYYENLLFFVQNYKNKTSYSIVNECLYNYCINDTSAVHSKKYNIKKLSSLEALSKIIPLLPDSSIDSHKVFFMNSYFNNLYSIKMYCPNNIDKINKYKILLDMYYKDIISSKKVSNNCKMKIIIMKKFNFIYIIFKKVKERYNGK